MQRGTVVSAGGAVLTVRIPAAVVGAGVRIGHAARVRGVVTAVGRGIAVVAVHDDIAGVAAGDPVVTDAAALALPLGTPLLGRAIDARGAPLDGGPVLSGRSRPVALHAPQPALRSAIDAPFWTGVRAIDALLTFGRGARIGIFGAPGCGKSTLLQLLVRGAYADAVVIALVGERGREAEEWIRACVPHAAVVCATGERSAAERAHAARVAMAQADALRARGLHVLLMLDSLARFAAALREIALAAGESSGRAGYPPSVFADLARLLEVAGTAQRGSITLVASVLSDGDDRDPVSDAARSLLDGHVALSPRLAAAGHFPAIDVLASASRTMSGVVEPSHEAGASLVRRALAVLARTEDARSLGIDPADPFAQRAVRAEPELERLLRQGSLPANPAETLSMLGAAADTLR